MPEATLTRTSLKTCTAWQDQYEQLGGVRKEYGPPEFSPRQQKSSTGKETRTVDPEKQIRREGGRFGPKKLKSWIFKMTPA